MSEEAQRQASPTERLRGASAPGREDQSAGTARVLIYLPERFRRWFVDVGGWISGGLMAITLVVISALITVGRVDAAVGMSTAVLAAALPLNVTGIVLLK